jgi:hypothetical protein
MAMRQQRGRAPGAPGIAAGAAPSALATPYDYGAVFELTGQPGNVLQDVVVISPDGPFVAVAIGYGLEDDRRRELLLRPPAGQTTLPATPPGDITLGQVPQEALIEGFTIAPNHLDTVFGGVVPGQIQDFITAPLASELLQRSFQHLRPPADITFLFSMVDSATGRELQDEPVFSLASLGASHGERPFRPLQQPLAFAPRSTIRMQVIERSEGVTGTLFIVLFGYRIGTTAACPERAVLPLLTPQRRTRVPPPPAGGVIPFDYVVTLPLVGRPGNIVEDEVSINVEGGYIATALGYGLVIETRTVALSVAPPVASINLGTVRLAQFPPSALVDGIRIRPEFLRLAFTDNGQLSPALPFNLLNQLFERLNRIEDVSFRYEIFDAGIGRDLQNRPLNNIAGLGIANGERPFKVFARPLNLVPRSTLRVSVREYFGRGELFLVFQGYKVPSGAFTGGGR